MSADRTWVLERLAGFGSRPALVIEGRTSTFADVLASVEAWSARLEAARVSRRVVVVNGDYSEATVGALLALYLRGCIAVPLHVASPQRLDEVAALTGAEHVIDAAGLDVTPLRSPGERHPLVARLLDTGGAGLVLITSGSTGTPKAMLLSLERLFERHRPRVRGTPMVTAAFLLFDHIGGFNTLVHCLFTGGTLVQLPSRDPSEVCRSIERFGIELLPATPTFLTMLLVSGAHAAADLGSLKLVTYGTEVMPPSTLEALAAALPHATLKQTYGSSELGILPTRSRANDSVWMTIGPGTAAKVVDGVLWIKSDTAMLGYLNAPSPFDEEGWMCTGDVVEVDGEYIRVHGRREQIINVGGLKVFPAEVEDQLLRAPCVEDAVVWGRKNAVTGFIVAASIAKTPGVDAAEAKRRILDHCRRHLDDFKIPRYIEFVDGRLHTERFKKAQVGRRG